MPPPRCKTMAARRAGGGVVVTGTSKAPYRLREQTAATLGLPLEAVEVAPTPLGGDFGGKGGVVDPTLCAALALWAGRPVRLALRSGEDLSAPDARHPSVTEVRVGCDAAGRLLAVYEARDLDRLKPVVVLADGAVGADGTVGFFPVLMDLPPHNGDGVGGMHLYMPWWNYQKQFKNQIPFARGYHIEFGGGRHMPGAGELGGSERYLGGGYGADLKRGCRKLYGAFVGFSSRGEMIPNEQSYCEVDKDVVDEWGIPVLKFHFKWTQDEILQARHARETFREIIETAGGEVVRTYGAEDNWGISTGGEIIHEVGTARMGSDRSRSALNPYCQAWDCKNLFVADGGPFVGLANKNPTLTILAMAWRTSDYIADQVRKGNV